MYFPSVFIFDPSISYPNVKIHCAQCQKHDHVALKGWPSQLPRRVIGMKRNYYILARQYVCKKCDYIFISTSQQTLKMLPLFIQNQFPAVLTHRSAVDKGMLCQSTFLNTIRRSQSVGRICWQWERRYTFSQSTIRNAYHAPFFIGTSIYRFSEMDQMQRA